jgi:predicted glycosyltransferase
MIGRPSPTITLTGFLFRKRRVIFAEDDFKAVFWGNLIAYPFAREIVTPFVTDLGWFSKKKIEYNGCQKLAYLHPRWFVPNKEKISNSIDVSKHYFILRFSKLTAYHDIGRRGIVGDVADKIIAKLNPHGNIYITSERKLEAHLEKYRIQINPIDMHHALYFAEMFIGDSQTMTAEAAVLGTPALRFNDFVGKLGYLEELEHQYGLTYGIKTSEPEKLFEKIDELLKMKDRKQVWQKRRQKMLEDKIDVTAFMVWFIENYPESVEIMKKDPTYQYRFK